MNGKYLVNFKAPIGNVEASLSVSGDDARQVIMDARQLLALARQEPETAQAQPVAPRQEATNGHPVHPWLEEPPRQPENAPEPECPVHHRSLTSKFGDWLYCPEALDDGTRCKWNTKPAKSAKAK